jgi:1-acyl-sn-glycerol-3-phosphate acyltransferase
VGTSSSGGRVYPAMIVVGRALFAALGLRRDVRHPERLHQAAGAVLAVTHFGYLDFALLEWAVWHVNRRQVRFLATARAFEHPVAGPLLRGMRHIPVERTAGAPAYRHAVRALRAGELVGVFPEGEVHTGDVGPVRTGAVRMAAEAGVPLVPVVVWGGHRLLTKGGGRRRVEVGLRRAFRARIVVTVGEPRHLPHTGLDVEAESARLRSALRALLRDAQAEPVRTAQSRTRP